MHTKWQKNAISHMLIKRIQHSQTITASPFLADMWFNMFKTTSTSLYFSAISGREIFRKYYNNFLLSLSDTERNSGGIMAMLFLNAHSTHLWLFLE
jgi:hypothetical protein